jgi:hypothetical protein
MPIKQSVSEPGLTIVAVLLLLAFTVFQALKAVARALGASVAASLLLVRPVLALGRLLLTVLVLLAIAVAVIVSGHEDAGGVPTPAPTTTQPAPAPIRSLLPVPTR